MHIVINIALRLIVFISSSKLERKNKPKNIEKAMVHIETIKV